MSKPKHNPEACDMCNDPIFGPCVIVTGIDDGRGLAMPAELQQRAFCSALCFYRWTDECRADTSRHERSHLTTGLEQSP
jgi:hypothetical protein